jgi:hypothetical protein
MTIVGTFNGSNIVAMPGGNFYQAGRTVSFSTTDSVAVTTSPFSLQSSYYTWAGADLWSAQVSLKPMTRVQAAPWIAFLMELRGRQNCFLLGDPLATAPRGTITGSPVVSGTNLPGSQPLNCSGFTPGPQFLPGDYINVRDPSGGTRLYCVLDNVAADIHGNAAISIWPSIRETPTSGQALGYTNCQGLFKLADNSRQWSEEYDGIFTISFKCVEFR